MKNMSELTATEEALIVFRKDGEIVAIERHNGHIERFSVEPMTRQKTLELFDAHRAEK